jgi:hypothetical protein
MVLLPEVQSDFDSISELDECLLRVNETEFLALLDNLVAAMRAAPR